MTFTTKIKWLQELPKIKELGEQGKSIKDIADIYGVTRQRAHQVVTKFFPEWHSCYGNAVHRKEKAGAFYAKWGVKEDSELYAAKRTKFRSKKANAYRVGKEFTITFGELEWPTHCPVLGIELDYFAEGRQENSVSFDCLDSTRGYVSGNVQVMSWRANRIKNDGTAEEHQKISAWLDQNVCEHAGV
jgi:hypothetical protein